jgi:hypothetical protein
VGVVIGICTKYLGGRNLVYITDNISGGGLTNLRAREPAGTVLYVYSQSTTVLAQPTSL